MSAPVRVLVHGASGRMGAALLRLLPERRDLTLVAACSRRPVEGCARWHALDSLGGVPEFDVAIDFSLPEAFDPLLALCRARGSGLVSGTTGLAPAQLAAIGAAAAEVPVLWAANFSPGVTVLRDLVERAARALREWDADIVEAHHVHKKDAPSGTALALGEAVEAGCGREPAYAALRAGDIVGEHTVQLTGPGERIELVHRAASRDIFAAGALRAAAWLNGRDPAVYGMNDCLGLG